MSESALCRTCARPAARLQPLFTHPERYKRYALALKLATGLQIEMNDGLPQHICKECSQEVSRVLKFRTNSQKAQTRLLELGSRKNVYYIHNKIKKYIGSAKILNKSDHDEDDFSSFAKVGNLDLIAKNNINDLINKPVSIMMKKELVVEEKILDSNESLDSDYDEDFDSFAKVGNLGSIPKNSSHDRVSEPVSTNLKNDLVVQEKNLDSDESLDGDYNKDSFTDEENLGYIPKNKFSNGKRMKVDSRQSNKAQMVKVKFNNFQFRLAKYLDTSAPLYTCKECKKFFESKNTLVTHTMIHTGLEHMCDRCGKVFWNSTTLLRHQRSFHGAARDIRLRCSHCEYHALDKENLKVHMRTHTGEQPYICDTCGAGFIRRVLLIQHFSVHMTEKNVKCKDCPAKFKSRHGLNVHRSRSHKPRRYSYKCAYCSNVYVKSYGCRKHMRKSHGISINQQKKPIRVPTTL